MKFLLESQDYFSTKFQIEFEGKRKTHSYLGMICSLMINIGAVILLVMYLSELISRSRPTVTSSKLSKPLTTNITLNTLDLLYSFGLRDKNYRLINDPAVATIVPIYEVLSIKDGLITQENIRLELINCSQFLPLYDEIELSEQYVSNGVRDYFCFNHTEPIILGGKYGTSFYATINVNVQKCTDSEENKAKGITCKTEEEIDELLQDGWIQTTYATSFVDPENYTYPIHYLLDGYYTKLDVSIKKMAYTYFNLVEFYTSSNIIFEYAEKIKSFKHEKMINDFNLDVSDRILFTHFLCPSFTLERYKRSYIKIQEIAANVSGCLKCMLIFFCVIVPVIEKRMFDFKIIDCVLSNGLPLVSSKEESSKTKFVPQPGQEGNSRVPIATTKVHPVSNESFGGVYNFGLKKKRREKIRPNLLEFLRIYLCICERKSREKRKFLNFLIFEKRRYTDFSYMVRYFKFLFSLKEMVLEKDPSIVEKRDLGFTSINSIHKKDNNLSFIAENKSNVLLNFKG